MLTINLENMIKMPQKFILLLVLFAFLVHAGFSQNKRKEKQAKAAAEFKAMVDSASFVFHAETANPLHGDEVALSADDNDLQVLKDTIIVHLPYYGDGSNQTTGINFKSGKFGYNAQPNKDGGWDIAIKPADAEGIEAIYISVSDSGYGFLQVNSLGRDNISFKGFIALRSKKDVPE
jgi:hypothetical protein